MSGIEDRGGRSFHCPGKARRVGSTVKAYLTGAVEHRSSKGTILVSKPEGALMKADQTWAAKLSVGMWQRSRSGLPE